ncbi:hypothetical protein fugu_006227 [Takifugu bimaculatus]|uniref:Uncharacterized protein n=1 Tax=Takifugu bimaculatus TaxID=433685 RepID=A0A4Z2B8Y6_9TELE|nr:hypothetical protein fugu_006227 [Takifugu bimaculatus]
MQGERKWHMLLTIFCLLITSGQCTDSKDVTQKERRTLLDLILQVIRDTQQREKNVSRRCITGLLTSAQDMKFSSPEKPFYIPRLDNSRLIDREHQQPQRQKWAATVSKHVTSAAFSSCSYVLCTDRLQTVCEVADAVSNEPALHAIVDPAFSVLLSLFTKTPKKGAMQQYENGTVEHFGNATTSVLVLMQKGAFWVISGMRSPAAGG